MLSYELKQKWVKAARSGQYYQVRGAWAILGNQSSSPAYCIMGLLGAVGGLSAYGCGSTSISSVGLRNLTGMTTAELTVLTQLNDKGMSFADLADWIEANVPCKPQELTIP